MRWPVLSYSYFGRTATGKCSYGRGKVRNYGVFFLLQYGEGNILLCDIWQPADYGGGYVSGKSGGEKDSIVSIGCGTADKVSKLIGERIV